MFTNLEEWAKDMGYKPADFVRTILTEHEGTWLPVAKRQIQVVEKWLGTPPVGHRWATRINIKTGQTEARYVAVEQPPRTVHRGRNAPIEDWEEDPYTALQQDAEQYPVVYQDGVPIQAGSEHDPRL